MAVSMDNYKEIGARIRETSIKKKMSQQDLGAAANISLPHISEIELGKSKMHLDTFVRIAEALQVSTDVLLRPDVPEVNSIYQAELLDVLSDCSPAEMDAILKIVVEIKKAFQAHREL